jgi:hypothetical protein
MADEVKTSPLPWSLERRPRTRVPLLIEDADGDLVADCEGADTTSGDQCEANARLVVRAVNCHASLVAVCEDALEMMRHGTFDNGVHAPDGSSEGEAWAEQCRSRLLDAIRSAKATTGKPVAEDRAGPLCGAESRSGLPCLLLSGHPGECAGEELEDR